MGSALHQRIIQTWVFNIFNPLNSQGNLISSYLLVIVEKYKQQPGKRQQMALSVARHRRAHLYSHLWTFHQQRSPDKTDHERQKSKLLTKTHKKTHNLLGTRYVDNNQLAIESEKISLVQTSEA